MTEQNTLIIGIIAILTAIGVPIAGMTLSDSFSELKDYYRCSISGEIKEFKGGVSSTLYSGYPYSGSTKGAVYCGTSLNKGIWIKLNVYAQSIGLDPYDLLVQNPIQESSQGIWGQQWLCNLKECVKI